MKYIKYLLLGCLTMASFQLKANSIEVINHYRSRIVLNGVWKFKPLIDETGKKLVKEWETVQVPGSWHEPYLSAEYEKEVCIPASWNHKRLNLFFQRVSTDAVVEVNGLNAGTIDWPSGSVDISGFVKYGAQNRIKVMVVAVPDAKEKAVLMGTAFAQVSFEKSRLKSRGITGNVILESKPAGANIASLFVKPSFRNKNIVLDVDLDNIRKAEKLNCEIELIRHRRVEKTVKTSISVTPGKNQTRQIVFSWSDAVLWDLDTPELYTLKLKVKGRGISDCYNQDFGFREFWIEGKNFFLNGKRINLRPFCNVPGNGMTELIASGIDGLKTAGFNFSEQWPDNYYERGCNQYWEEEMEVADRKGYLLSGVVLPVMPYMRDNKWNYIWDTPKGMELWKKILKTYFVQVRNHPSVIMWGTSGNFFGNPKDQNPLTIGTKDWYKDNKEWTLNAQAGQNAIDYIKTIDPTRVAFTHHGAYVGDIHTLNFYLCMLPLQERMEWLSHYSEFGEMPFMGIEFGTPLHCTFLRGRNGYGNNIKTEPLVTEFTSAYFGEEAYTSEPDFYRNLIKEHFIGGQEYKAWPNAPEMEYIKSFQDLQYLFSKNTWRAWRTWGISGGMVPWNNGHGWQMSSDGKQKQSMPPFEEGRTGMYFAQVNKGDLNFWKAPYYDTFKGGKALIENDSETLAYIAGGGEAFTSQKHSYRRGDWLDKRLFFFNDTRHIQDCRWIVECYLGKEKIKEDSGKCQILPGEKASAEFYEQLPRLLPENKTDGMLVLIAEIGRHLHRDTLTYRVFGDMKPMTHLPVFVYDPIGKTKQMLIRAGYQITEDLSKLNATSTIVIGRESLCSGYRIPFDMKELAKTGARVIVFAQKKDYWEKQGFRMSEYVSRYVFPVGHSNEIMNHLDETDMRNWSSSGTIREAYPDYLNKSVKKGENGIPYFGWHWGNRGSVASISWEKPHYGGWTPLLSCEFDMAYTPLMEMNTGKGRIILCGLDLEDNADDDPAAEQVLHNLLAYNEHEAIVQRNVAYFGDAANRHLVDQLGVKYSTRVEDIDKNDLLICGEISAVQEKQISKFVVEGGTVLLLPRKKPGVVMGVQFIMDSCFVGGMKINDGTMTKGLSLSDTRYRTSCPSIVIESGCEKCVDGLLGTKNVGKGRLIFCQFDPDRFDADNKTYFRYTRWRTTRALSQVLSNAGADFKTAFRYYHPDYIDDFKIGDNPFRYFRW